MLFPQKEITLKNGCRALLESPVAEDAAEMLAYLKTCAGETPFIWCDPEECTQTEAEEALRLAQIIASATTVLIACTVAGEIAGSCQLFFNSRQKMRHRASINIAILQKFWGMGIGTALMRAAEATARAHGVTQLELGFMEGNARAQALYEKMGFRLVASRPNAFRMKDGTLLCEYLMVKEL